MQSQTSSPPSEEDNDRKLPAGDPKDEMQESSLSRDSLSHKYAMFIMEDTSEAGEAAVPGQMVTTSTAPSLLNNGEDQDMRDSATASTSVVVAAAAAAASSAGPTIGGSNHQIASHAFDRMDNVDLPVFVKAHKGTLTFPEKLMIMLIHIERKYAKEGWRIEKAPIAWTKNGRAFVIRDNDKLVSEWLPIFFPRGKFSSFKRKLYRWGFRQVQLVNNDLSTIGKRELVFGNENFQRDQKILLPRMKSVTAESLRRQQASAEKGKERVTAGVARKKAAALLPGKRLELASRPATQQSLQDAASLQNLTSLLLLPSQSSTIAGLLQPQAAAAPMIPPSRASALLGGDLSDAAVAAALSAFNPSPAATAVPSESQALGGLVAHLLRGGGNNSTAAPQYPHNLWKQPSTAPSASDTPSAAPATDSANQQAASEVGLVSELLRGVDSTTLQHVVNILQEEQQRQQQEAMVKNIQRLLLQQQHQAAQALPPSAPASDALLASLLLQQLGRGSGGGGSNNAGP